MLMRPNKAKTAVHGCRCPGDMAVCMRKVLARLWIGVRVYVTCLYCFSVSNVKNLTHVNNNVHKIMVLKDPLPPPPPGKKTHTTKNTPSPIPCWL